VQEIDIVSLVKPITKYAITVIEPADIRFHLEKAVYLANPDGPDQYGLTYRWMYRHPILKLKSLKVLFPLTRNSQPPKRLSIIR
jgi:hypothetical protein